MSDTTDIWMPLYIGEYLADTMHLSAEENGAYLLLMMHYWRHGAIKNDATVIQQIARIKPSRVSKEIVLTVSKFFEEKNGYLYHRKLDNQIIKAKEKQKNRSSSLEKARTTKAEKNASVTGLPLKSDIKKDITNVISKEKTDTEDKSSEIISTFFGKFWPAYPSNGRSRGSKQKAYERYQKLYQHHDAIMEGVKRYEAYLKATGELNKDAVTWLNQRCWEDDYSYRVSEQKQSEPTKTERLYATAEQALTDITGQ